MARSTRVTATLPEDFTRDLDLISARLGITRSALVTVILGRGIPRMLALSNLVPANFIATSAPSGTSDTCASRYRGASATLIQDLVTRLESQFQEGDAHAQGNL